MFKLRTVINLAAAMGIVVGASATLAAASVPDAGQILAASDAIRNPAAPFAISIQLTEYRNKILAQEGQLTAYAKMNPSRGQYDSLVRIAKPARDHGKLMLKNGNEIWFYDPATKAGMRISPQQRLLGEASNGDVVTVNLARDYQAQVVGEESIVDGEHKNRTCYRLKLVANNAAVTYHAIDYWVEEGSNRPVKADFYSESGRLLKTGYYRQYEQQLGEQRPTETVIIDGIDPQLVTVMKFSDYRLKDIPESWLQRDGLARFQDSE